MYLLLCGAGVGFSVQKHHIARLPNIKHRFAKKSKVFTVPDSIEGWADAFGVLLASYFVGGGEFPEYEGCHVLFDLSKIRPKGAFISGGFKAPGPDGLRASLQKCEELLERELKSSDEPIAIRPIVAYDFTMHMSDAVLSGGVRRSATLCMFSKDDHDMMTAKTGDWFIDNPQRGRSNNSAMLLRDEITWNEWTGIMESVKQYGEPGFIFTDSLEHGYNPCVEIGMLAVTEDGRSGFSACNLTEINGALCNSKAAFFDACEVGAIMGTLQAGYTDFPYLGETTEEIIRREALLGVSITGWMNSPDVLFDPENLQEGAEHVKAMNKKMAAMLGINPAARTTCTKPSGNASVILGTASGIHGEHSPRYFRNVQMNDQHDVVKLLAERNPSMVEESVWSAGKTDKVVSFPIISQDGSIYKDQLLGVKQLEYVKIAQQNWVVAGTNEDLCTDPKLRHNVSNTITVDDWDEVTKYIFDNRYDFAGISLLAAAGDKAYAQAPFTEVRTADEIMEEYGEGSLFASGLIVDALHAFNDNLWAACETLLGYGEKLDPEDSRHLLKRDWVRRAEKFSENFFEDDLVRMTNCLKDCHNLHKWTAIVREMQQVDFASELGKKEYTEVDTMGAQACSGDQCEINF